MKIIRTFFILSFTALVVTACGSSKENTINRGRSNTQVSEKSIDGKVTTNRSQQLNNREVTTRDTDIYNLSRMEPMYLAVDMEKEQITRFERGWESSVNSWKKINPNKAMNNYERVESQDKILRNILSDSQYKKYQKWVIDNAGE